MNSASIVSKVWSFCTTLRDDGVGYGDYLEQLTYLIFLKMADEYAKPPYSRDIGIPKGFDWTSLTSRRGAELDGVSIHAQRMPGRLAHHEIVLGTQGQTLSLRHDTIGRDCYMPGVLTAVRQVVQCKGLVVGLEKLLDL